MSSADAFNFNRSKILSFGNAFKFKDMLTQNRIRNANKYSRNFDHDSKHQIYNCTDEKHYSAGNLLKQRTCIYLLIYSLGLSRDINLGPYSPTILKNVLRLVPEIQKHLKMVDTTSDWLKRTV